MSDKVTLLKEKAIAFRTLLEQYQDRDSDAMLMLKWLTPLFDDIASGKVKPPTPYKFRQALGRDHPFYEPTSIFSEPNAEFGSALEDWPSQPWYQEALKRAGTDAK